MSLATNTRKENLSHQGSGPFFTPDCTYLSETFCRHASSDPMMRSPGYIRMTSRKGLSAYSGRSADVLFSLHPNDDETYIIYPPAEEGGYRDVRDLGNLLKQTGKNVEVIRIPMEFASSAALVAGGTLKRETRLDYAYPVHVIEVGALADMEGSRLQKFRNKVNAAKREGMQVRPTDFAPADREMMRRITTQWAPQLFNDDVAAGTEYIGFFLDEMLMYPRIRGLISLRRGEANGFTVWELPCSGDDTAHSLIHCSLHHRGVSELLHHEMAKALHRDGVRFLSLGGAETAGLDAFKRKMNPVRSVELATLGL